MFAPFKLDVVDADGAIREAADAVDDATRRQLLRKGALAGAGAVAGAGLLGTFAPDAPAAKLPGTRKSRRNDIRILNFALTLEFLEAEFYVQAVRNKTPNTPALATFTATVRAHELTHVRTLRSVLAGSAVKKPRFDFGDTVTEPAQFARTSQMLEDTGVTAYIGQAKNLSSPALLTAAASIATVEARHAGWIRFINGGGERLGRTSPAPASFDTPMRASQVMAKADRFIKG